MGYDRLRKSTLPHALSDVVADLADLLQKELRLASAEVSAKLSAKLQASAWLLAAAACGLIAMLLVVQALVFAIADQGIAIHWSCLIVAGGTTIIGALAYLVGRSGNQQQLMPTRTIHQISQDITTTKEYLR